MNGTANAKARVAIELENGDIYSCHNAIETILIQWGPTTVSSGSQDSFWLAPLAVAAFRTEAL